MTGRDTNDDTVGALRRATVPDDTAATRRDTTSPTKVSPDVAASRDTTRAANGRRDTRLRSVDGLSRPGVLAGVSLPGSDDRYQPAAAGVPKALARPLPIARLVDRTPTSTTRLVVTTMDVHGRLGDRTPLQALGWLPNQNVAFAANAQAGVLVVRRGGPEKITSQGHVRIPPRIQHVLQLARGDHLLVAALAQHDILIAHTLAAVDAMVLAYHSTLHGDPS
ncbi:MAG TPA: hypothetical protein VFC19_32660 [Candidatus Limnocylindrales bacterium]|nr:hypothetical protein [Candidatus Limnocylindrales bacterium]